MVWLSLNPKLDFSFVKANPEGLNGQAWDMKGLSQQKFWVSSDEIFFSLPFTKDDFKEAFQQHWADMYYRPATKRGAGGPGYLSQIVEWSNS